MKKELIDSMGSVIEVSISPTFLTDANGRRPQGKEVSLFITSEKGKESFVCLNIDTAILLTDAIQRLAGQILLEEAREKQI
ncbi:MAG: hypothetical protein WCJ03_09200 [Bacteroidales bacterium]